MNIIKKKSILIFLLTIGFFCQSFAQSVTGNLQVNTQLNGTCLVRVENVNFGSFDVTAIPKGGYEQYGIFPQYTVGPTSKIEYLCSKGVIGKINYSYSDPDTSSAIRPWGSGYLIGQKHGEKISYSIDNLQNRNFNNLPITGTGQWKDWSQESNNNVTIILFGNPVPDVYIGTVIINITY